MNTSIHFNVPDDFKKYNFIVDSLYRVSADENNGRIGYMFLKFDKTKFLDYIEGYVSKSISDSLVRYDLYRDNGGVLQCCCNLENRNLHEMYFKYQKSGWNQEIIKNEKFQLMYKDELWGTLYREVYQNTGSVISNEPKRLIDIGTSIELTPKIDTAGINLILNLNASFSGKILNHDCPEHIFLGYSHATENKYKVFPVRTPITIQIGKTNPDIINLYKKATDVYLTEDSKDYYIYFVLKNPAN